MAFDSYGQADTPLGSARVIEGDCAVHLAGLKDVGQVVVLDPPAADSPALPQCLRLLRGMLAPDAVVALYAAHEDVPTARTVLERSCPELAYQTEAVIWRRPALDPRAPLDTQTQALLLYAASPCGLSRPGSWDTLITSPDSPKLRGSEGPAPAQQPPPSEGNWDKSRKLQAARNYRRFLIEAADSTRLDDYYQEILDRTGVRPDFIRLSGDGEVQLYRPAEYNLAATNIWLDLKPDRAVTGHPHERDERPVARFLEWFANPGATVLDPFCGSGTTLAAAVKCGRDGIGIELSPNWCAAARTRVRERVPVLP